MTLPLRDASILSLSVTRICYRPGTDARPFSPLSVMLLCLIFSNKATMIKRFSEDDDIPASAREEAKSQTSDGKYRTDIIWNSNRAMKRADGQSQFPRLSSIALLVLTIPHSNAEEERVFFTITAEIHGRSLANFYCQYADRHMNLKFVRRVSEREPAIRQFVIVKNKLMSVFNASVLLLIMNFVITLSK